MNIFVGNLSQRITEDNLRQLFIPFGKIESVKIITDFSSGLSRGFGFVEMTEKADGMIALKKLNNVEFMGNAINLSEAMPKPNDNPIMEKNADANASPASFPGRRR